MAGSTEAFAEKMNETAHALGATDTHFVNPHGLNNEDHYTTAYDLYLIFNEALKYPEFRKIIGTVSYQAQYTDSTGQAKTQEWKNSNQYLNGKSKAPGRRCGHRGKDRHYQSGRLLSDPGVSG